MARAIVVGAGHNGLAAAFHLARAGLDVEIVESQDAVGGACRTEELIPGYRFSTCANYLYCLRPQVLRDMRLLERGLEVSAGPYAHVLEGNRRFVWWVEEERLEDEVARLSRRDVDNLREWNAFLRRATQLLGRYLLSYPPTLEELSEDAARLGSSDVLRLLVDTSWHQLVDAFFESPRVRDLLLPAIDSHGGSSSLHPVLARAMSSYSETGEPPPHGYVRGGMGRLTTLMWEAAAEQGANLRLDAPATRVIVEGDRVVGVELASGEQVAADVVVSNADVKRTMLDLAPYEAMPPGLVRRVSELRTDVSYLKFHCALSGTPEYYAFDDPFVPLQGGVALVRSRDHLEQSLAAARRGLPPADPAMEQMIPSAWDAGLAPPGHHTASFFVFGAPVRPATGPWETQREEMTARLLTAMDRYSPNFRRLVVDSVLFTPADLERRVLLTDGNIHHLDFDAGQLFTRRPCVELARYRAPVSGLYLCGSGQHPGGEVTAAPGHNAAHAVLEDLGVIKPSSWQQRFRAFG